MVAKITAVQIAGIASLASWSGPLSPDPRVSCTCHTPSFSLLAMSDEGSVMFGLTCDMELTPFVRSSYHFVSEELK